MKPYVRRVQYYETDMMGIVHHANYIHWMEEARIDFMDQLGYPYARMEAEGFQSPVRGLSCQYRQPCRFGDTVAVEVSVIAYKGVLMTLKYDIRRADNGDKLCEATSEHVFVNREGRLIRLERDLPEFSAAVKALMAEETAL